MKRLPSNGCYFLPEILAHTEAKTPLLVAADSAVLARVLGLPVASQCRRFDLTACSSKAALLIALATGCRFADDFGHNWDALADAMMDDDYWPKAPAYALLLSPLRDHIDAEPLLSVLADSGDYWQQQGQAFYVLCDVNTLPVWPRVSLTELRS